MVTGLCWCDWLGSERIGIATHPAGEPQGLLWAESGLPGRRFAGLPSPPIMRRILVDWVGLLRGQAQIPAVLNLGTEPYSAPSALQRASKRG